MALGGCEKPEAKPATAQAAPDPQCFQSTSERDTTFTVFWPSLIELIARPELYQGKRVLVAGFANLEFEGNGIYVSREDYDQMLDKNGLWLDVSDSIARRFAGKPGYVIIEGEFDSHSRGHFGMWSGTIKNISRFEPNRSRSDIRKRMIGK
jgi:hypothetical protein